MFKGLVNLQKLNLDSNDIVSIEKNSFIDCTKLVYINIESNPISDSILNISRDEIGLNSNCMIVNEFVMLKCPLMYR